MIYPPVETTKYAPVSPDLVADQFLVVSRLVGYKRVDLAIDACNHLGAPLHVVGSGPDEKALRRRAGPTVRFLGRLPDVEVTAEYALPGFYPSGRGRLGLTPLEAMASGRPVVAFGAGGALRRQSPPDGPGFSSRNRGPLDSLARGASGGPRDVRGCRGVA